MRNYLCLCVSIAPILVISACKNKQPPFTSIVIDIDNIQNDKATVDIIKLVALENTIESQFGEISRLEFYSNRYFIFDQFYTKSLFVFDSLGYFINKTKIGRGPDECINPTEFVIDKENNCIIVWDQARFSFMKYTLDLNYIESIEYKGVYLRKAIILPNRNFLVYSQNPSRNTILKEDKKPIYYNYFIYDHSFDTCLSSILPTTTELARVHLDSPISNNVRVLFITPFDNTVYTIQDNIEKVVFRLDFGSKKVSANDLNMGSKAIYEKAKLGEKVIFLDNVIESIDFLSFSVSYMQSLRYYIYSKNTTKVYDSSKLFSDVNIPKFNIRSVTNNNHFLGVIKSISQDSLGIGEAGKEDTEPNEYYVIAHILIKEK